MYVETLSQLWERENVPRVYGYEGTLGEHEPT